jgi:hypothetical protein
MGERGHHSGKLSAVAVCDTLMKQTLEFVWRSLLPWRDDPERPCAEAEEDLNAQLQNFLQSRAVHKFPMVLFQHEQRQTGGRRVDLSAKPSQSVLIQGRLHSCYDPFLVMEGKRLPAPAKSREREYVTGETKASGGIQRFKLGWHGRDHRVAVLLGYVQTGTPGEWLQTVNTWIQALAREQPDAWDADETLTENGADASGACLKSTSVHAREPSCASPEIRLEHFWVGMKMTERGKE